MFYKKYKKISEICSENLCKFQKIILTLQRKSKVIAKTFTKAIAKIMKFFNKKTIN